MDIGNKIRSAREGMGYSQEELAKFLGITARTLQNYEYNKSDIGISLLIKMTEILKVDSEYFLKEDLLVKKKDSLVDSLVDKKGLVSQSSPQDSSAIQKNKFRNGSATHSSPQETSSLVSQNKFVSEFVSPPSPPSDPNSYYIIPKLTLHAQAGGGNELLDLECYESGEALTIDKAFFRAIPQHKLKAIKVEGYSMIPMLLPDSWVVFEEGREYKGDGLYIINYAGQLMVKLLQLDPVRKILDIVSVNKEYKSYSIPLSESQVEIIIIGKVLRCII